MALKEKLTQLVTDIIAVKPDIFLVDILALDKGKKRIVVLLDGDSGVDIEFCAEVSRKLGNQIEADNLIEDAYTLEVSSPGIDFPIKLARQYFANIGRILKVETANGIVEGELKSVTETTITIEIPIKKSKTQIKKEIAAGIAQEEPLKNIEIATIKKAMVQISV
jgi:ribosome maturation factor RimP